ncbi:hypothetical protein SBRCBS47491_002409 [Sporothrix bragantina]|uniref:SET domain-containing protein n=1 Tax=Sporothrix bragantina TaxID=671064 RepID=A0ABP0B6V4_9PEZI
MDYLIQHTPWTQLPRCLQVKDLAACVYTRDGLSLVTTLDAASDAAAAVIELHKLSQQSLFYEVREIPGKGKGAVATRDIPRGTSIITELPLLLARLDLFGNETSPLPHQDKLQHLLQGALAQLSMAEQQAVQNLAIFQRGSDTSFIEDVLRTNGLGVNVGGIAHTGLYPRISRLNHACRPNTFWRYSPRTLAVEFVALRDIAAGEELTHSYIQRDTVEVTRHDLLTHWGFNCTCEVCSSRDQRQALDDKMARLKAIEMSLSSEQVSTEDDLVSLADEMMALVDGDDALLAPRGAYSYHLVVAAQAAWTRGFGGLAQRYTEQALAAAIVYGGPDDEHVGVLRQVLKIM